MNALARVDEHGNPLPSVPPTGAIQREDFGGSQIQVSGDRSSQAMAAQAEAEVNAAFIMAERHPRDWDICRAKVIRRCKNPSFAEKAWYRKPIGKKKDEQTGKWVENFAEGLSVRFVETATQAAGNMLFSRCCTFDSEEVVIFRVTVMDLENNVIRRADVVLEKKVERSNSEGRTVLGSRKNSYGKTTYIVRATEDEMLVKVASACAKAERECGRKLIPGDILEDAERAIHATMRAADAQDPEAARKALLDAFADISVPIAELKEYVGHDLATLSPAEMAELRQTYRAIRDGEATWVHFIQQRREVRDSEKAEKVDKPDPNDDLKKRVAAKAAAVAKADPPPPPHNPDTGEVSPAVDDLETPGTTARAVFRPRNGGLHSHRGL